MTEENKDLNTTEETDLRKENTTLSELLESERFKTAYLEEELEKNEDPEATAKIAELKEAIKNFEQKEADTKKEIETLKATKAVPGGSSHELETAHQKINQLILENQQLKLESEHSQKQVGEVMITAKQQAAKMVADAKAEITRQITEANQEMSSIGEKASAISSEIKSAQTEVDDIFSEVGARLSRLENLNFSLENLHSYDGE